MIKKYEKVLMIGLLSLFLPAVITLMIIRHVSPPANIVSLQNVPHAESAPSESNILLDINTATAEELEVLPGIGTTIARRIVAYRIDHGIFHSPDELIHVHGISENTLESIKPYVTTGGLS